MRCRMLALCGAAVVLAAVSGRADASLYMKIAGVDGDVTAQGYEKSIAIDSFDLSITRGVASPTGGSADRETSKPLISDLHVTAQGNKASVPILQNLLGGPAFDTLNVYLTKFSPKSGETTYAEWKFEDVLVSSFATASGGDRPSEAYAFNFTKFTYTWHNFDPGTGQETGTVDVSYDLASGKSDLAFVTSGDTAGFQFLTAVPEPGSVGVMAVGAMGLVVGRRRRK